MDWQTVVIGVLVLINLIATSAAMRSGTLSGGQRLVQVALIWLLPLIGAVICLAFVSTETRAVRDSMSSHQADLHAADGGATITGSYSGDCFGGGDACGGGDGGGGGGGD